MEGVEGNYALSVLHQFFAVIATENRKIRFSSLQSHTKKQA